MKIDERSFDERSKSFQVQSSEMIHTILFIKSRISFTLWEQKRPRTYSSAVGKTKKTSRRTRVIFPAREHINVTLKIPSATVFYRWTKIEFDRKCSSASEWKIMIICSTTSDGRHLLWFHVEFLFYKSHSTLDVWKKFKKNKKKNSCDILSNISNCVSRKNE